MSKLIASLHVLPTGSSRLNRSHPETKIDVTVKFKYGASHRANLNDINEFISYVLGTKLAVPTMVDAEAGSVHLTGDVKRLEQLFNVELNEYSRNSGGTFRHFDGHIELPNHFDDKIIAVLGLTTGFRANSYHRVAAKSESSTSYYPEQVAKLYNFPAGDGTGQTIGVIELGGAYNETDCSTYAMSRNLPLPNITVVPVDGAVPKSDANADGEVMLDLEIISSIACKSQIVAYFGPNTAAGFDAVLSFAVNDTTHKPSVLSISWGGPENSYAQQDLDSMNQTLSKASSLGINVFIASGDSGSSDGTKSTVVDFPASSPFSIGTGGTYIQTVANNVITNEVAWGNGSDGASGGGYSQIFSEPSFQDGVVSNVKRPKPKPHTNSRGVPDVAGNGSPDSGYNILVDGQEMVVAGTSAVAPLYAALTALLNQNLGKNVGWLNPIFYKNPQVFLQITSGTNGAYNCGPGWNAVCGLGRVNGNKLLEVLKN